MPVRSAVELMILLLYAQGHSGEINEPVKGITRFEKLMFLLLKEGGFEPVLAQELAFKPYDFGPYSGEIYDLLESLKQMGLVQVREEQPETLKEIIDGYYASAESDLGLPGKKVMEIYSLEPVRGGKVAERLLAERTTPVELETIERIKSTYNRMSLDELLKYVYLKYPDSAKRSKILDEIIGFGSRPELPSFVREEET